jgi:predicted tellurium resistance membrane protein TerC
MFGQLKTHLFSILELFFYMTPCLDFKDKHTWIFYIGMIILMILHYMPKPIPTSGTVG